MSVLRKPITWLILAVVVIALLWLSPFWIAYTQVSPAAIHRLPARMRLVRPGMTEAQVWRTLGIPQGCFIIAEGSGPRQDYRNAYRLPYGYQLYLVFDQSRQPAIFKRGSVTHRASAS